jgi:cyclic pyranopterin monophosphate synthase
MSDDVASADGVVRADPADAEPADAEPVDDSAPGAASRLTHLDGRGAARMVDVSGKPVTARTASARGRVLLSAVAVAALRGDEVPKGDALAVARIAGLQAAKMTPTLVPLAHPVAVHAVVVDLQVDDGGVDIAATVRTADRTGIEMEALTCVTVAALALVDMVKAVDRRARITDVRVTAKSGGRSGDWVEGDPVSGGPGAGDPGLAGAGDPVVGDR